MKRHAIIHASEVWTGSGIVEKRGRQVNDADCGRIPDGAIVWNDREIEWVGPSSEFPSKFRALRPKNLKNKQAVIPGLIDCHTHLIFAGDRAEEFALRCGGATYEEIAQKGGGIQTTVNATREASKAELLALAQKRLDEMKGFGVRTVEVKSGYGLDFETELKILEVARELQKKNKGVRIVPTFLGAHAIPAGKSREEYVREVCEKMLPAVAQKKLAEACDIFVDRGYFTVEDAQKIFEQAKKLEIPVKIHADELVDTSSSSFAAKVGALSADHLLQISEKGIADLAASETVAVLLPATAFYLKTAQAPARELLKRGARVALSTDFNPGTSMCLSLPAVMTIAALYLGMTRAEIFAAVTHNAARALGLHRKKGALLPGMDPDVVVLPFARFEEVYYKFAWSADLRMS